jgi:predicted Rossmann fold nucleotide-binding protein DprA/Smf involved in DNA uptake
MNGDAMELPDWAAARWPRGAEAPDAVWANGADELLSRPMVAVIGSREASPRGLESAQAWAGALADEGIVVLSGGRARDR